jgi:hypothetical protein
MKCQNNLHELGLGVHNYESTWGLLPPLVDQGAGAPTGTGVPSAFVLLMPYMDQVQRAYSPELPPAEYYAHSSVAFTGEARGCAFTEQGGIANQSYWKIFLDPADDTARDLRDVPMTLPDGTTGYYAAGSYAANGLLPWGVRNVPESFPRGTQNSVLFGERPQVCRTAAGDSVHNLWGVGFYSPEMPAFARLTPAEPAGLTSTGQAAPAEPLPAEDGSVLVRVGRQGAAPQPADFTTPLQRVRDGRCDPRLLGGPHPAGMQVLMADGSARVFDWGTSPWVFWSACVSGKAAEPLSAPDTSRDSR